MSILIGEGIYGLLPVLLDPTSLMILSPLFYVSKEGLKCLEVELCG
jgi:hypothetical protein